MNAAHTPGLLSIGEDFTEDGITETVIRGLDGHAGIAVALDFGRIPGMREANARRLVACWNACNGLPTESLDGMRLILVSDAQVTS